MSQQTLWKRMAERGLILTQLESGKTRYTLKRQRAGSNTRVIVIEAYPSRRSGESGEQTTKSRAERAYLLPTPIKKVGSWWGASNLKWGADTAPTAPLPTSADVLPTEKKQWGAENNSETPSQTQPDASSPLTPLPVGERVATENFSRETPNDSQQPDAETGVLEL